MQGHITSISATTVKDSQYKQFEAWNAAMLHMIKNTTDSLKMEAGLFDGSIIDDVTHRSISLHGIMLANNGTETTRH